VQKRQVYVFRQPDHGIYREQIVLSSNDRIAMQSFPDVVIDLNAMFPKENQSDSLFTSKP
jgi:Uma2 family endonuclease